MYINPRSKLATAATRHLWDTLFLYPVPLLPTLSAWVSCLVDPVIVIDDSDTEPLVQAVAPAAMVKFMCIVCVFDIEVVEDHFHLGTSGVVQFLLDLLKGGVHLTDTKLKLLGVVTVLTADYDAMAHGYCLQLFGIGGQG